jgi:hypothetical protein
MLPPILLALPIALSSLLAMPAAPAVKDDLEPKDVKIKALSYNTTWYELSVATSKGYCVMPAYGTRLSDTTSSSTENDPTYIYRLVEKDGKATLEKARLSFDAKEGKARVGTRVSVALAEITRANGVAVWGYKEGANVVLLARGVDGGVESAHPSPESGDGSMFPFIGADGCPYAMARLDLSATKTGAIAQLTGNLPTRGKGKDAVTPKFIVDASLSKLSRDPEPLLSVRVRMRE